MEGDYGLWRATMEGDYGGAGGATMEGDYGG